MSVRAKAFVQAVTRRAHNPGAIEVQFGAATRGEENKVWSEYTPVFQLTMNIKDGPAANYFELGQEYYVDFSRAEERE